MLSRLSLTHCPEKISHLADEQVGLLERGEVTALRHFVPMPDIAVTRFHPAPHWRDDLFWKHGNAGRYRDLVRGPALWPKTLPIEACRRGRGRGYPVQHDIVEQFVPGEDVFGMAVAVGPGPEFFEDPRGLAARRIGQAITQRLRPGRLLLGITGIPIGIIADPLQRVCFLRRRLSLDIRPYRHRQGNVNPGAMIGVLRAERGRDRRAPIAALRAVAV